MLKNTFHGSVHELGEALKKLFKVFYKEVISYLGTIR